MNATLTLLALSGALSGAIEVESVPECVDPAAVVIAVDAAGGIELEERIQVVVSASPAEALAAGSDPFVVDVDIELLAAPPLHRVVPIRAIECKDVADLVAVLLANHRRAHPKPLSAPPPAKPKQRERAQPRPATMPRPDARPPSFELGPLTIGGWEPCSGPPSCGDLPLNATVGVGATLPFAGRVQADVGFALDKNLMLVVGVDAIQNKSAGAFGGVSYRVMHDGAIELSIRALVSGGGGRRIATVDLNGNPCPPTGQVDHNAANIVEINGLRTQLYAAPIVAARMRLRWVFVEAGGFWQVGVDDTPGMYLTFGVALLQS